MKLRFKHQKFQSDAAKAVVDVFCGQPNLASAAYRMDRGEGAYQPTLTDKEDYTGRGNAPIVPELSDDAILRNLQKVQRVNGLKPSDELCGRFNLTIEMETGVGKTYTYIKTMYELNKHYGWSKFIVVVPSIAIREGVYKSFCVTQEHFGEAYGKKARFFIYNSSQLTEIDRFASDNSICAMIINSQAFNAKGKDARRIGMKLDAFRSRRPIDIIAKTNPILIIDEPQSVEGKKTKESLKQFNPLFTLRYSATHKSDSIYNMVYRLDALEAYNKHLVKKIAVKGISASGTSATESYVYLESVNVSKSAPTATIQFDAKGKTGIRQITRTVGEGYDLHAHSGNLEEYANNYKITRIDGRDNSVTFCNGIKIYAGDVAGKASEDRLRRIQIRETILSHLERERDLFGRGIKTLSLFFIDEVSKYRVYEGGEAQSGIYARMFEEEYRDITEHMPKRIGDEAYRDYLRQIPAEKTHAGYFSIDKGKMVNPKASDKKAGLSDDKDAYDLIMRNKELLLDRDPQRSPVRFIFSHSALREGWDNPNVFQICTLKQSSSATRKRQEVGRGMRLCVNAQGERMDENVLGNDVHRVNVLTVIASESYESFAKGLQSEIAEAVADRPRTVTASLFEGKVLTDDCGNERIADGATAQAILYQLIRDNYIDSKGMLTDAYYADKRNGAFKVAKEAENCAASVEAILDSVYDSRAIVAENARANVELSVDEKKLGMPEFKALWQKINAKTAYIVDFDTEELIAKAINAIDSKLRVAKIYYKTETGEMKYIESKQSLSEGSAFVKERTANAGYAVAAGSNIKYDLVGKIVEETQLTRKAIIRILKGIKAAAFDQFKDNPEEFIIKASGLINDEKASAIIQHITYNVLDKRYDTTIFTDPTIKGKLGSNAMASKKHLYDHVVYDSENERRFAEALDTDGNVAVYIKLPGGFYISTPVGRYNPDWAIAFYKGTVKHIYFVAETKGSLNSLQLRSIEDLKIRCAREHFKAISNGEAVYDVVNDYQTLLEKVMQ